MSTKTSCSMQTEIPRRNFLKSGLALGGAATLGRSFLPIGSKSFAQTHDTGNGTTGKWVKGFCASCIFSNCGTEYKIVDGVAVELRGNKEHPSNKGTLCPRGAAQLMNLYNPYRLKTPVKRTNPQKGLDIDPGWVEISWEEALQTVTERLQGVLQTDPRKLVFLMGFAANVHENCIAKILSPAFGTPNNLVTSGPLCEVHYSPKTFNGSYIDRTDLEHCNYLVLFGRGSAATMHANGPGRFTAEAIERGMKLIVVDPHASADASKGEWVPIRPGTDLAMAMSILHGMLHEIKVFDVKSAKQRTNAPYLIKGDGTYQRDLGSNKPMVWDLANNMAKVFDDPSIGDVALEGDYTVYGAKVTPAFALLKKSVESSTPEWAEKICGVPATIIRRITADLIKEARIGSTITIDGFEFPYRAAALSALRGSINQPNGLYFSVLIGIINVLLGGMGVPGSVLTVPPTRFQIVDGMLRSEYQEVGKPKAFSIPQDAYTQLQFYPMATFPILGASLRAILDPKAYFNDYDVEVLWLYGSNPFQNFTDPKLCEAAFAKVPFMFATAYHIDESALFADILFPESSTLERYQTRIIAETMAVTSETINLNGLNYREPVLDKRLYDTKQFEEVVVELFTRLGIAPKLRGIFNGFYGLPPDKGLIPPKPYTYREMLDVLLKAKSGDPNKGADWFKEHGFLDIRYPLKECYDYYLTFGKARLPVYDEFRLNVGRELRSNLEKHNIKIPGYEDMEEVYKEYVPLPVWHDNFLTIPSKDYDLMCVNWRIGPRNLGLGGTDDNAWLLEVIQELEFDDLKIQINTATAKAKGLKTGDRVIVESQHGGKLEGIIKTTELIHPECLGFPGNTGRRSKFMNPKAKLGCNYNQLLSSKEGILQPTDGAIVLSARVKITKA